MGSCLVADNSMSDGESGQGNAAAQVFEKTRGRDSVFAKRGAFRATGDAGEKGWVSVLLNPLKRMSMSLCQDFFHHGRSLMTSACPSRLYGLYLASSPLFITDIGHPLLTGSSYALHDPLY